MPHRFRNHSRYYSAAAAALFLLCSHFLSATTIRLAWDPSPDPNVVGYNLSYGTNPGKYSRSINAGNATSVTVPSLTPGTTYFFVVTAYNNAGLQSAPSNEVTISLPENVPPSVSLTSPQAGTFDSSSPIGLTADASDSDGMIVKVEFYQDTTKIGEAVNTPYSSTWSNPTAGDHMLTALAYDDNGAAVRSAGIAITVSAPSPTPTPSPGSSPTPTATPTPTPTPSPTPETKIKVVSMTPLIKAGQNAKFKITAADVQDQSITVNYSLGGTALGGVNYSMLGLSGHVTILAGTKAATLTLSTIAVPGATGSKTAIVTLMPGPGYTPARSTATVKILSR